MRNPNFPGLTDSVLTEIYNERANQDLKWGTQNHPMGASYGLRDSCRAVQEACDKAAEEGTLTWMLILDEEVTEASCEVDPARMREELVQVAAVAVAMIEAIDRG